MKKVYKVVVPVNSVKVLTGCTVLGETTAVQMNNRSAYIPSVSVLIGNKVRLNPVYRYIPAEQKEEVPSPLAHLLEDLPMKSPVLPLKRLAQRTSRRVSKKVTIPQIEIQELPQDITSANSGEDCIILSEVKPAVVYSPPFPKASEEFTQQSSDIKNSESKPTKLREEKRMTECVLFYDRPKQRRQVFDLEGLMERGTHEEVLEKFVQFARIVQTKATLSDEQVLQLLLAFEGDPKQVWESLNN